MDTLYWAVKWFDAQTADTVIANRVPAQWTPNDLKRITKQAFQRWVATSRRLHAAYAFEALPLDKRQTGKSAIIFQRHLYMYVPLVGRDKIGDEFVKRVQRRREGHYRDDG
jgi:hypothetical protein